MATPGRTHARIWSTVRRIPRGKVATYGQIAAEAGFPGQARLVGYALHALSGEHDVPWQRVINARGEISLGGVGGSGGIQRALLEREGIEFDARGRVDLARYQWEGGRGRRTTTRTRRTETRGKRDPAAGKRKRGTD